MKVTIPTARPGAYAVFCKMAGSTLRAEFSSPKSAFEAFKKAIQELSPMPSAFNATEAMDWARSERWFFVLPSQKVVIDMSRITA